jgi:hypothetical protein
MMSNKRQILKNASSSWFDLGIRPSIIRYVARYSATGEFAEFNSLALVETNQEKA